MRIQGNATVFASIVSLCASAMGSGVISLGHGFANTGVVVGVLLIVFCTVATDTSLRYIVELSRCSRENSYEGVAKYYLGGGGKTFLIAMMVLLLFGMSVLAQIIVMDLLPPVFHDFGFQWDRWIIGLLCVSLVFPLTQAQTLNALRFTSALALCGVFYLVTVLAIRVIGKGHLGCHGQYAEGSCFALCGDTYETAMGSSCYFAITGNITETCIVISPVQMFEGEAFRAFLSMPLIISSFTCQFNIVQIDQELRDDLKPKIGFIIRFSMYGIVMLVYIIGGLLGYGLNGRCVSNDLLKDMKSDILFRIGRVWISCTNLFKIPLYFIPMRNSLNEMINWNPSKLPVFIESLIIYAIVYMCAVALGSVSKDLGLVGCTAATCVIFIVPALCYLKAPNKLQEHDPLELSSTVLFPGSALSTISSQTGTLIGTTEGELSCRRLAGPGFHYWFPGYSLLLSGLAVFVFCPLFLKLHWAQA